jgi:hypothetical protein
MKLNYFSQRTRPAAEVTIPSLISGAAKRDTWVANIINGQSEQEHVVTELSGSLHILADLGTCGQPCGPCPLFSWENQDLSLSSVLHVFPEVIFRKSYG